MTEQPPEEPVHPVLNPRVTALELEMAYTSWDQSCQDPHVTRSGDLRECRRAKNHPLPHASGHTANKTLRIWT